MALSPDQTQRISTAVGQKVTQPCPVCGQKKWGWGADLVVLHTVRFSPAPAFGLASLAPPATPPLPSPPLPSPIQSPFQTALGVLMKMHLTEPPPPTYPTLPLICGNCGNTMLLNVYTLGIADIWPDIATPRAA